MRLPLWSIINWLFSFKRSQPGDDSELSSQEWVNFTFPILILFQYMFILLYTRSSTIFTAATHSCQLWLVLVAWQSKVAAWLTNLRNGYDERRLFANQDKIGKEHPRSYRNITFKDRWPANIMLSTFFKMRQEETKKDAVHKLQINSSCRPQDSRWVWQIG